MKNNQEMTKQERQNLRLQEKQRNEIKEKRSRGIKKWVKISSVLLLVVLGIGSFVLYGASRPSIPTGELLSIKSDDWTKGNYNTKVTMVEYLDFECEACGQYYPLVNRLSEEFKDEVQFVTRYFPLPGHKNSMTSALAVEAAGKQGKYWEMYNIVFGNQNSWGEKQVPDPKIFEAFAEQIGLDMVRFKADVDSTEVKDRVLRDKNSGMKLNIQGTPSFFLNGKQISNPRGYEEFKALLQAELEKVKR